MRTIEFFETLASSINCDELAKKLIDQMPLEVKNAILNNDQKNLSTLQTASSILANETEVVNI